MVKIVEQSAALLWITPNPEQAIEQSARTCYKSEDRITSESSTALIKNLIARGHEAMLEHASASIKFVTDRGCCYSEDTSVLTTKGWKLFKDVEADDLVYTLNDKDELVAIQPQKKIATHYNGPMYFFRSTQLDLLVTPNHNMWVFDHEKRSAEARCWKFLKAEEMTNGRYQFNKSCNSWNGNKIDYIELPAVTISRGFYNKDYPAFALAAKPFFKLLGIWMTDGCLGYGTGGSGNRVSITQVKETGCKEIERLLKDLDLPYSKYKNEYRIGDPRLFAFLAENFIRGKDTRKSYYLRIPTSIKTASAELLQELLDGIILGDGTPHSGGPGHQIYTSSYGFAEDLVEIALKIGLAANIYAPPMREHKKIRNTVQPYVVSIVHTTKTLLKRSKNNTGTEFYDGMVYCLELPAFHRLYVMRNGKPVWCGNSHELVRHRLAAYAQESTRYCNYGKDRFGKEITVIRPPLVTIQQRGAWELGVEAAERAYMDMLEQGCTPQIARSVLPTCLKTEIVTTANLREWRHIFKMRLAKDAHPQIRHLMALAWDLLCPAAPTVFAQYADLAKEARHDRLSD